MIFGAMTIEEPNVSANSRYDINAACTLLGVSRKTLGKYTSAGLIKCGIRACNGRKFYLGSELLRFWKEKM